MQEVTINGNSPEIDVNLKKNAEKGKKKWHLKANQDAVIVRSLQKKDDCDQNSPCRRCGMECSHQIERKIRKHWRDS